MLITNFEHSHALTLECLAGMSDLCDRYGAIDLFTQETLACLCLRDSPSLSFSPRSKHLEQLQVLVNMLWKCMHACRGQKAAAMAELSCLQSWT